MKNGVTYREFLYKIKEWDGMIELQDGTTISPLTLMSNLEKMGIDVTRRSMTDCKFKVVFLKL